MLSKQTITAVKSTIPVLANAGVAITEHFYQRLFSLNPELKHVFNMSNQAGGAQPFALFNALAAYATYIDDLDQLNTMVSRIANKHVSLDIQAEHYPIVGEHLLATLAELAPETFNEPTLKAWEEAYAYLANAFIDVESTMYASQRVTNGGWNGKRLFKVIDKVEESEQITSFYFIPVDQQPIRQFKPGQYITVNINGASDYQQKRQYSLSQFEYKNFYRISVKRETGEYHGLISNYLHDEVKIGCQIELIAPAGDFVLRDAAKHNVLISAGVGITPMFTMLQAILENKANSAEVTFIHACKNAGQHAFHQHLRELETVYSQLHYHYWYETNADDAKAKSGFIDFSHPEIKLPIEDGDFYLCGPVPFMRFCKHALMDLGVKSEQIYYEVFGPHNDL